MKDIEKILAPFSLSLGKKQDLGNLLIHLKKNDVSTEEVIQYINDLKEKAKEKRHRIAQKLCPECEVPMQLLSVNNTPESQTGDPTDKSVWVCYNKKCMHTIYNKKTIKKILSEISKEQEEKE